MDESLSFGLLNQQPVNKNNLLDTKYRLMIKRLPNITYFCQSSNVPGISIEDISQYTVFNTIKRPGGEVLQEYLTVNFLVDEDLKNWLELYDWIMQCSNYKDFTEYKGPQQHFSDEITLHILTSNNNPFLRLQFSNAFPIKLSGIELNSSNNSNVILCNATFAYTTFNLTRL